MSRLLLHSKNSAANPDPCFFFWGGGPLDFFICTDPNKNLDSDIETVEYRRLRCYYTKNTRKNSIVANLDQSFLYPLNLKKRRNPGVKVVITL